MDILHAPNERFRDLPKFAFKPYPKTINSTGGQGIFIHHIEEGSKDGTPTWSYSYCHMINPLAKAGRILSLPAGPDEINHIKNDLGLRVFQFTHMVAEMDFGLSRCIQFC